MRSWRRPESNWKRPVPACCTKACSSTAYCSPIRKRSSRSRRAFPGVVREVHKRIGDRVEKGALLAKVESNQSLTVYELRAPLAGTVIDRQVALGEHVGEQKPAFTIADLSTVWVDFSVYRRDLKRVTRWRTR